MSMIILFIVLACLAAAFWLRKPEAQAKHKTVDFKHTSDTTSSNASDRGSDDTEWTTYLERF